MIAGLFEVCWAIAIKYSQDFSRPVASTITLVAMALSVVLLANATKTIPIGTAYAVWTSIGAVGAAIYGMIVLGESAAPLRLLSLAVIVVGICGLKLTTH